EEPAGGRLGRPGGEGEEAPPVAGDDPALLGGQRADRGYWGISLRDKGNEAILTLMGDLRPDRVEQVLCRAGHRVSSPSGSGTVSAWRAYPSTLVALGVRTTTAASTA